MEEFWLITIANQKDKEWGTDHWYSSFLCSGESPADWIIAHTDQNDPVVRHVVCVVPMTKTQAERYRNKRN